MHIEIYSKDNCGQCNQAKALIKQKCLDYNEYVLGKDVTIQDLQERVSLVQSNKPLRQAPQIFVDDQHIGAYNDFVTWLSNQETHCPVDNN